MLEDVARLGVRLLMQTALEAEVTEFFGRDRYARGERAREGSRNGYWPVTVKTTAGPVTLDAPEAPGHRRGRSPRACWAWGVTRTNALESLVIAGFVRGLSVRDIEATLAEALGSEATLSKSTVTRICEAIKDEFEAWGARDLAGVDLDYLYLDGSHFKFHAGSPAEPVLAAWGITTDGQPQFVGLAPGAAESPTTPGTTSSPIWSPEGWRAPLLVISDGAPGLIGAAETVFPHSLRQRCLIHRARNILAKVPKAAQAEVKAAYWQLFDESMPSPAKRRSTEARRRIEAFVARYERQYPAAMQCLIDRHASRSPSSCGSRESTGTASGTPTSSSAPSGRPAGG